jgi:hypothetical protein
MYRQGWPHEWLAGDGANRNVACFMTARHRLIAAGLGIGIAVVLAGCSTSHRAAQASAAASTRAATTAPYPRDPGTSRVLVRMRQITGQWLVSAFTVEGFGCPLVKPS